MLSNSQIDHFRTILLKQREDVKEHLQSSEHFGLPYSHPHESVGELSSYDNHPADDATELYEREKDIALNEHAHKELEDIESALQAIENGTYGICQVCSKEIPLKRLEALPNTTFCKEHSPDQVTSHQRPVEEGVLMPPFGKFSKDEEDENVSFDAEDSWQIVSNWGNSQTPSDMECPTDSYQDISIEPDENEGYVEDYENFVGVDIEGKNMTVFPNKQHEKYEQVLDEEGIMTPFGDLPAYEHEPYVEE
jgi:YteA family regulatory protein